MQAVNSGSNLRYIIYSHLRFQDADIFSLQPPSRANYFTMRFTARLLRGRLHDEVMLCRRHDDHGIERYSLYLLICSSRLPERFSDDTPLIDFSDSPFRADARARAREIVTCGHE